MDHVFLNDGIDVFHALDEIAAVYCETGASSAVELVTELPLPSACVDTPTSQGALAGKLVKQLDMAKANTALTFAKVERFKSQVLKPANKQELRKASSRTHTARPRKAARVRRSARRSSGVKASSSSSSDGGSSDGGDCPPPPYCTLSTPPASLAGAPCASHSCSCISTLRAHCLDGNGQPLASSPATSLTHVSHSVSTEGTPCVRIARPVSLAVPTNRCKPALAINAKRFAVLETHGG